ncbi:hypothetical protein [Christiangramia forsetii]|uniref:Membrane protein n=2 Tax=Christiangramia forsetii TaxID=411153 RepID=A0M3V6_CHRFK|nr:hypothetical protein [Christiangramia forsetii]GGG24860.1 hypothetical protein GCM10011532_05250 [Christiangramia forsetii]CAL67301.1 membrane protein [Christiangramia forsetii KT0803]
MKLIFPRTDIRKQLLKVRNKNFKEDQILKQVTAILAEAQAKDDIVLKELQQESNVNENDFDIDLLESDRIFHVNDIYTICINYRLRFLDTRFFKSKIPYEALMEIKKLEQTHKISLKGFKIIAPSSLFKLENADDPLLFAPIGNDYYYLIHKWGNDLHPFRKLLMWPFKTLENFAVFLLATSFLTALLIPEGLFTPQQTTTQFFMIFFFVFKWFAGLSIFYGFKMGKNFSTEIWNSKFYNA